MGIFASNTHIVENIPSGDEELDVLFVQPDGLRAFA